MEEAATKPVTPFQRLGGAETFHAIADRFYALMDADPAYADLRAMHGEDLAPMKASLAGFLIGWSGGPRDWFAQGKCMMSLHRPLPIAAHTAQQWADAMRRAIGDVAPQDAEMAQALAGVLEEIALSMAPLPEKV
jgi:hemoglobin